MFARLRFENHVLFCFIFFFQPHYLTKSIENSIQVHCSWISQILLFSHFFIKNGSHSIIHTFKNYFISVFSVSIFNFSKNKLNTNGFPITLSSSSHSISDLFFLSNNHRDYQYLDGKTPNHQSITHQRSTTHKSELKSHQKKKKPPQPTNLLVETTTVASPPSLQSLPPQTKTINRNPTTADPRSQLPKSN